jgi:hypothetical protein
VGAGTSHRPEAATIEEEETMTSMTPEAAAALRAPFQDEQVGKLPKPTKRDNAKGRCDECGGYHGLPAVHLDYVGHAATTDRLLQVDPEWTWEPMVVGPNGEPLVVNGGLWIKLTVCGVTRPGFGDATGSGGMKEMIGDAIRNAAMRFGVALDLWSKQDLHDMAHPDEPQEGRSAASGATERRREFNPGVDLMDGAIRGKEAPKLLGEAMLAIDPTVDWQATVAEATWRAFGKTRDDLTPDETREFWTRLSNAIARVWADRRVHVGVRDHGGAVRGDAERDGRRGRAAARAGGGSRGRW